MKIKINLFMTDMTKLHEAR